MAAQRSGLTQALGLMKKSRSEDPWYVDLIARGFSLFAAFVTGTIAYSNQQSNQAFLVWVFGGLCVIFLLAATVAPRHVRIALVGWLPGI